MYIDIPRAVYQYVCTQLSTIDSFMNTLLMREILHYVGAKKYGNSQDVKRLWVVQASSINGSDGNVYSPP